MLQELVLEGIPILFCVQVAFDIIVNTRTDHNITVLAKYEMKVIGRNNFLIDGRSDRQTNRNEDRPSRPAA